MVAAVAGADQRTRSEMLVDCPAQAQSELRSDCL